MALTDLIRPNVFPSLNPFWDDFLSNNVEPLNVTRSFNAVPKANISESEDQYSIELAVPGLTKNDFNVDVADGYLTISSETESNQEEKEKTYFRQEYSYSSFSRSFKLPTDINEEEIYARYEEGILRITIAKAELTEENKKTVSVQ